MNRKEAAQLINATLPCHRKLPFRDAVQIAIANGLIPPLRSGRRATVQDNQQGQAVVGQTYPRENNAT